MATIVGDTKEHIKYSVWSVNMFSNRENMRSGFIIIQTQSSQQTARKRTMVNWTKEAVLLVMSILGFPFYWAFAMAILTEGIPNFPAISSISLSFTLRSGPMEYLSSI